jgi:hypothetical protein
MLIYLKVHVQKTLKAAKESRDWIQILMERVPIIPPMKKKEKSSVVRGFRIFE